jgi:hypothetical protein
LHFLTPTSSTIKQLLAGHEFPDREAAVGPINDIMAGFGKRISPVDEETSPMYRNRAKIRRVNYLFMLKELQDMRPVLRCSHIGETPQ